MTMQAASDRLLRLEKRLLMEHRVAFTLDDGGEFTPSCEPFHYLAENGRRAPDGKLITGIRSGVREADSLTESILGTLNEVAAGRMPLPSETVQAMNEKR